MLLPLTEPITSADAYAQPPEVARVARGPAYVPYEQGHHGHAGRRTTCRHPHIMSFHQDLRRHISVARVSGEKHLALPPNALGARGKSRRARSIARIDHAYYTDAHGYGQTRTRRPSTDDVGRDDGSADDRRTSVL